MPLSVWDDAEFAFLVSFSLPLADVLTDVSPGGDLIIWHRDGSIAHLTGNGTVRQAGPRKLGDVLGRLWRDYQEHGCPPRTAYRMVIAPDGARTVIQTWGEVV